MTQTVNSPLSRLAGALAVVSLAGALSVQPAQAQAGSRFQVLVPNFEPQSGAKKNFGEDAAKELRKLIDDMATHSPVESGELKQALKKYGLKEDQLDCIKARQLAIQMNVQLVLCGSYDPQGQVQAKVVSTESGEEFQVPQFAAAQPKQAAQQIFANFERYMSVISAAYIGHEYLQSQNYASALENFNRAIALNPNLISAQYGRGRALMEMDSLPQALEALEKVIELQPTHQDAMLTAGVVAAKLGREDQARSLFADYLELNPGSVEVRLKVATDLANAGDPLGALEIAQKGLEEASDNLTLQLYVGHFALAAAEKARQQGANGEPTADMAQITQLYETALQSYERVFQAAGDTADASMLRNMINVLSQLERHDEAARLGQRIVAVKADDADIWMAYAQALSKAGRTDEASAAVEKAVAINPDQPNAHAMLGQWLVEAGKLQQARQQFERSLGRLTGSERAERSDQFARVVFAKGYNDFYRKQKNTAAALDYFGVADQYATASQTKSMISFWTGFALYERGQKAQEPNTLASARASLPIFQRAKQNLQAGAAYARTVPSIDLAKVMDAVNQFIEIQELLIKRGR